MFVLLSVIQWTQNIHCNEEYTSHSSINTDLYTDHTDFIFVFKSVNGFGPKYIPQLLIPHEPIRNLRLSGSGLFIFP